MSTDSSGPMSRTLRLRRALRASRQSRNPLVRAAAGVLFAARETLRSAQAFLTDATYRSVALVRWFRPRALHQTTVITWMDRYPQIFGACRDYFGQRQDLKVLSFGCSTGEEVVTLRTYFASAWIVGAEINRRSLAVCRARSVDERTSFVYSTRSAIQAHGPFDAIFCMAVLQRTPHKVEGEGIASLKDIYPFEKFEQQVSELDAMLRPGGLLIVHHTQYRLRDTGVGSRYTPLTTPDLPADRLPLFDRNSVLIPAGGREASVFVKHTG
jgi:hypothetical protein